MHHVGTAALAGDYIGQTRDSIDHKVTEIRYTQVSRLYYCSIIVRRQHLLRLFPAAAYANHYLEPSQIFSAVAAVSDVYHISLQGRLSLWYLI